MRIMREFDAYNPKRYARPYIAKVTAWPIGDRAELAWGTYIGDENGGEAEVEASVGDVIRYGQRDNRTHHGNASWAIVDDDGSYHTCNELEAAKNFRSAHRLAHVQR